MMTRPNAQIIASLIHGSVALANAAAVAATRATTAGFVPTERTVNELSANLLLAVSRSAELVGVPPSDEPDTRPDDVKLDELLRTLNAVAWLMRGQRDGVAVELLGRWRSEVAIALAGEPQST